jgi:hypothetical protein
MSKKPTRQDRADFLESLKLWDRPEQELYGRPLGGDVDTDGFVDELFSIPGRGLLRS